jgi:hypothetical protein
MQVRRVRALPGLYAIIACRSAAGRSMPFDGFSAEPASRDASHAVTPYMSSSNG